MNGFDLLATSWISAGDAKFGRGDELSSIPIETRIATAGAQGWAGFGFHNADLAHFTETHGLRDIKRMLDDAGIRFVELEFMTNWWTRDERRQESDRVRRLLLEAAEILDARAIKIGAELEGRAVDFDQFCTEFDALATEAGNAGTRVALEPMPFSHLRTTALGIDVVRTVDNPHGGLTIDCWHVYRSGDDYEELEAILPADKIFVVEIDDGDSEVIGTLLDDTLDSRRMPMEGVFHPERFAAMIMRLGFAGPWGVEILSEELRQMPMPEGLQRAWDTGQATLREAMQVNAER